MEHPEKFPHLIATWAIAVAQALDEIGLDSKAIFADTGIDLIHARDPNMRIPAAKMTQVYNLAEKLSNDPAFGLSIARFIHPTSLNALGYSLFASRTMETFCRRIVRYFRLVTTNAINQFEETETDLRLIMMPATDRGSFIPQDSWLAMIVRFGRDIYRPNFSPIRVKLRRPEPKRNKRAFIDYFQAPVDFGHKTNVLIFDKQDMRMQLPAANAELARQNDQVVLSLLARMDREDIITQVRASVVDLLPSGECCKEKIAERLHMSERTLQGRLSERKTSYRNLLNETRKELAEQYISQDLRSFSEVTYLLGFADISSFSRAFRNWTGLSPTAYRGEYLNNLQSDHG